MMAIAAGLSALVAAAVLDPGPPHSRAALELQTGPVILALAAPQAPVRVLAAQDCLTTRCPALAIRFRRQAPPVVVRLTAP